MLGIFNRNVYLADQLEGLIDIHNHILPGIDDGASNLDDSLALLRAFNAFGVTDFVATPHMHSDLYPNTPDTITRAHALLLDELKRHPDLNRITIDRAAEHMIDSDYEEKLDQKTIMPLRRFYMLVEVSFLQPSINFDVAITKTQNLGYYPILAHPERYAFLHGDLSKYRALKSQGIYFQVNLLSLAGHYGTSILKEATKLLKEGLVDFVGTDVHNMSHIQSLKNAKINKGMKNALLRLKDRNSESFLS